MGFQGSESRYRVKRLPAFCEEKGVDEAVSENDRIKYNLFRFFCDFELNRPHDEMDEEAFDEYVNELLLLQGKTSLTPEEISERVARIPFI